MCIRDRFPHSLHTGHQAVLLLRVLLVLRAACLKVCLLYTSTVLLEFELLHSLNDGERLDGIIELLQSLHGQLSLRSFEAVSYTHLDVYKRQ